MKTTLINRLMKFIFVFTFLLFISSMNAFAQITGEEVTPELVKFYFGSLGLVAAATLIIVAFIRARGVTGFVLQYASWFVALILAFVGYAMHWGMFETISIGWTVVAGFGAGLIANGIADTKLIQSIYDAFHKQ